MIKYTKEGSVRKITLFGLIEITFKKISNISNSNEIQSDKKNINPTQYPICLSEKERKFLIDNFEKANSYLEFGAGGSTFLALLHSNIQNIISVESDFDWIEHLREWKIIQDAENKRLTFFHVNIGKTKEWGYPVEDSNQEKFLIYSSKVFQKEDSGSYDLVFIDGRFRVACMLQTILNCKTDTKIIMHDFNDRPEYHVFLKYVNIVDTIDTMALFKIKENINYDDVLKDYELYKYNPN